MLPRRATRFILLTIMALCGRVRAEGVLFDFEDGFRSGYRRKTRRRRHGHQSRRQPLAGTEDRTAQRWPGITLKPAGGIWDLSSFQQVAVDVKNLGDKTVTVNCRLDTPDFEGQRVFFQEGTEVGPGVQTTLKVTLQRRLPATLKDKLFGMRGYPGGCLPDQGIDPSRVDAILIFASDPKTEHRFLIDNIRTVGTAISERIPDTEATLFPMIDKFGQYIHKDWPGKTHSEADLKQAASAEKADLQSHPAPSNWNEYGGWAAGPKLQATRPLLPREARGQVVARRPHGTPLLVPWNRLRSHVKCRHADHDREHYFADLPDRNSPSVSSMVVVPGRRTVITRASRMRPSTSRAPTCCESTVTRGKQFKASCVTSVSAVGA